jgi:hypothetical protein
MVCHQKGIERKIIGPAPVRVNKSHAHGYHFGHLGFQYRNPKLSDQRGGHKMCIYHLLKTKSLGSLFGDGAAGMEIAIYSGQQL